MTAPQEQTQAQAAAPQPEESQQPSSSKRRKSGWRYKKPPDLTLAQETTFLNMQLRKTSRALSGAKTRNTNYEFFALAVMLVVIYSAGAYVRVDNSQNSEFLVTLTLGQVVAIGIWMFLAAFVTATFADSRFLELLTWMFIYLPLLAMVTSFVFDTENAMEGELNYFSYGQAVGIILIAAEILAVAIFVCIFYVYAKLINSERFRRNRQAARFWKIKTVSDWTMTYLSAKKILKDRHTCKYQGETNADGLPHGIGRWFDDSTDGEILTGTWKNGIPVAPFVSRHYGRGDLFSAVRVAYVMASDDDFSTSKFWPTADNPPRCGIGSVECSVAGLFYNELPCATMLQDEVPFEEQGTSLEALLKELRYMGEVDDDTDDHRCTTLTIKANDPRGVQIPGLVHAHTGKTFNKVDEILIKVEPAGDAVKPSFRRRARGMEYMPSSRRKSMFGEEYIAVRTEDDDSDENLKEESGAETPVAMATIAESKANDNDDEVEVGFPDSQASKPHAEVKLTIENWRPAKHKDALVFFAGFNCPLKEALQGFGQFIAMTKLDAEIYPILYAWPSGQVLSYHSASRASHRAENKRNLLALFKSLQHAGIRTVHLMSHSMGAQSLVGAFCDNEDGSRSDISKCFREAHGWIDKDAQNSNDDEDENLLVCKTLTMLNPDWPLESFVNHAFRSLRRVCATITVVGDRTDFALLMSQVVNGIGVYFGYQQPREFMPNTRNKKSLCGQMVVGKHIDQLYLPEDQEDDSNLIKSESLLFKERAPMTIVAAEDDLHRSWLDMDVIDTSGLDTNIAGIRHSAFNLNPILLNDLEELIKTNNRAMKRTSLLYRDGNIFSYCHAPSYVSY